MGGLRRNRGSNKNIMNALNNYIVNSARTGHSIPTDNDNKTPSIDEHYQQIREQPISLNFTDLNRDLAMQHDK